MSDIKTWDPNAAGNTEASPDGWPEGMNRTGVNNSARELMAAVRRWYADPEWLQLYHGLTVTEDAYNVVRIADVDATGDALPGRRVFLSGGSNVFATIVSSSYSSPDTIINLDVDPGLGHAELAAGVDLTFADVDPDTITAASGTPFSSLVAEDRVRVEGAASNDGTFRIASEAGDVLTLEASEALTDEGPVAARIFHEHGIVPAGTDSILFHLTRDLRDAAFRAIGSGDGELLTLAHLGTHVQKREGAGGGIDVDTLDGKHLTEIFAAAAQGNLLINGEFRRWQEGASFAAIADATYCAAQWKLLSDGSGVVDVARETGSAGHPQTAWSAVKVTQVIADKKWALYQMVEHRDAIAARGQTMSLSFQAKLASGDTSPSSLRFAIYQWVGVADAPNADPITAWPAAGADPTPNDGVFMGAASQVLSAGSFVECKTESVAISIGATNIGVMIWSDDDTIAAGDIVYISQVRLEVGNLASAFVAEKEVDLVARTDRFFAKTFPEATAPADLAGVYEGALLSLSVGSGTWDAGVLWAFPVRMHSTPTIATYSPGTATPAGRDWWNRDNARDEAVEVDHICDRSAAIMTTGSIDDRADHWIQAVADARFF